jgi:tripartite-type tricarboxylate transporter receptor subunit TctC
MTIERTVALLVTLALSVPAVYAASPADFPNKPVRIVTSEPGGSLDFTARVMAQDLTASLGQQVIVENRGGASGAILAQMVARASPDGYTMLYYGSPLWILPLLQRTSYDAMRDFSPITIAISSPNILVVHPSLPVKTVAELIALAQAKPGQLNYGTGATGGPSHLAAELFSTMARVKFTRVPYRGNGPAVTALVGGEVHLLFASAAAVTGHIKSGRLTALGVTSAKPSALFPGLPAIAGAGVPGYEAEAVFGILAPAGTPRTIVNRLNREIVGVLQQASLKEKFFGAGVEVVASTPESLAATMKSEVARIGKLIKEAGIKVD